MKAYKFLGKALLIALAPVLFTVIGILLMSAILAILDSIASSKTYAQCFVALLNNDFNVCFVAAAVFTATVIYLLKKNE